MQRNRAIAEDPSYAHLTVIHLDSARGTPLARVDRVKPDGSGLDELEHVGDDERMPEPATLVLLTGPPGTGKSTLAEHAGHVLGAPVLGWDWAMAALTPFDEIQESLAALPSADHRRVGWSILWNFATAQLRQGRSVVLDGVARDEHVAETRGVADAAGAACFVVATSCSDFAEYERRLDGRTRAIPGWHELEWADVANLLASWTPTTGADLTLDAMNSLNENCGSLERLILGRR